MIKKTQFEQISYLMIETNSSCNLKCSWCNRERLVSEGLRSPKNLTPAEFKYLLSHFESCSIDTIKLEGLSEPMLHPQFDEMAKVLRNQFPEAFVIIATNCQYNVKKTRFIDTLPFVDMIYLSVDGIGEVFEKQRKGASYKKLLESFDQIKELTQIVDRQKKMFINFTATEENIHHLPEIYKLKEYYNFAGVRINLVQNWNEDEKNQHQFSDAFLKIIHLYKQDLKGVPGWEYSECFWPYAGIIVDVFGDFRQCIINTSQKPLGNLYKDDIREIFNSSVHYQKVREELSKNCAAESCINCDYKHQSELLKSILGEKHLQNKPRDFTKC